MNLRGRIWFVRCVHFLNEDLYPLNRAVYDSQVAPAYAKEHGHAPADPHEVKAAYFDHPFFRTVLAVYRTTQEMLWDDVGETVERQLPALIDRARGYRAATGTLRLDPDLEISRLCSCGRYPRDAGQFPDGDRHRRRIRRRALRSWRQRVRDVGVGPVQRIGSPI